MNFSEISAKMGISQYPAQLEQVYEMVKGDDRPACNLQYMQTLQQEYNLFGEFYPEAVETAEIINADPVRSLWIKTAAAYGKICTALQLKRFPVPSADGSAVTAWLSAHMLIRMLPDAIRRYKEKGFSRAEIQSLLAYYRTCFSVVQERKGICDPAPFNYLWQYCLWQSLFAGVRIFQTHTLQFELHMLPESAVYLKNKDTGKVVAVVTEGLFHKSGMQLVGSKGYEDDTDAFSVSFEEDAENYYGYLSLGQKADQNKSVFSKSQWSIYAKPGDDCLSIHIPIGSDITPENLDQAIASAKIILRERFPEHSSAMIYCATWLLDPILQEILTEKSNILQFASRFVCYPQKCSGMHVFGFVFPKNVENYESLPETTLLERGLKSLYLSGQYVHFYHGIVPE